MGETKIIYHLDDQETPYLVKLSVPADKVTLADFKNVLKKPNYKFFFKSMDDDFGVVKEEISDDNAKLPCFNGRVVSWVGGRQNGYSSRAMGRGGADYDSCSSFMSSELESTSCFDSEDDDATSSSITDSTMSLNIITVTLNMEKYNFLGISIVNDINFENMSNDDAVRVLRDIVHKPGPITLTVAKCWDPNPRSCFALPRSEPIRPIDPAAWVSHTAAMTGVYPPYGMSPSMSTVTSTSSSISSSIPETERFDDFHLSIHSDMATVAKAMACPESGLEVRDRMWLKITIANAFIARKYASNLLKAGYIRHTVNKITFSEQCYYVFGDLCGNMTHLSLHDHDGSSGGASDQDTLPPLPHPGAAPWPMTLPYQFPIPHPYDLPQPFHGGPGAGSAGSQHSGSSGSNCSKNEGRKSGGSGSESEIRSHRAPSERSVAPPSERSVRSSVSHRSANSHSIAYGPGLVYGPPGLPPQPPHLSTAAPGAPPGRELASVPPELTASRQSLRMAVGNAGEFFVDAGFGFTMASWD
ncbi:hypothetical protein INR49_010502 [Caranx melampygus]|nr:hypothetical protein INR49_010502 [Caranx melampygus]